MSLETSRTFSLLLVIALTCAGAARAAEPGTEVDWSPVLLAQATGEAAPKPKAADTPPGEAAATAAPKEATETVTAEELGRLLSVLDPKQRDELLGDEKKFKQYVENEIASRATLRAAHANKVDENPTIALLMQRAGQRVVLEAYLSQVVRQNLDPKFPSDEEVKKYYEDNRAQFQTPERIHLWQIFFSVPEGADGADAAARAQAVAKQLRSGKKDFATAASESSQHQASRYNGGYMGLIRIDELLPEVKEVVLALKENTISEPVKTKDGYHIVKRGTRVPPQPVPFADVQQQIRQAMISEAGNRIRAGSIQQIRETYPVATKPAALGDLRDAVRKAVDQVGR